MGVRGLWKMVKGEEIEYDLLKKKRLCVDGNFIFFPCINSANIRYVTEYTLDKVGILLNLEIDPIFVFDGKKPLFKRRPAIEKTAEEKLEDIEERIKEEEEKLKEPAQQDYTSMGEEDFSSMQISRIVERHKYIKKMEQNRMHGETNLMFELKYKDREHKKQYKREQARKRRKAEYKNTCKTMDDLKDLIFDREDKISTEEKINTIEKINTANDDISQEKNINEGIKTPKITQINIPYKKKQTEYERQKKTYSLPREDALLTSDSIAKSDLSLGCKVITDILDALSVKYIVSPAESDAVYAEIERALDIDGVITDDSDILIFSSTPVYKHFFSKTRPAMVYKGKNTPLGYNWTELVLLAWMLGSDYTEGIKGIGPSKAHSIILMYRENISSKRYIFPGQPDPLEREIDTEEVGKVFAQILPDLQMNLYMDSLFWLTRIYSETQFSVKIENIERKKISIHTAMNILSSQTAWPERKKKDFIKVIEKENKSR